MKVIVTGGCGFIGSHLVDKLLDEEHNVTVIDNCSTGRVENLSHQKNKVTICESNISIPGEWQNLFEGTDWVFHLAALADIVPSIEQPENYYRSNVDGTFNVLSACRQHNIKRLIYSASSSCYGIPKVYPTKEISEILPQYPYALTKRLAEELVMHWAQLYKIPSISLRFFNVYGPRSRTSGTYGAVFGVFLSQKLAEKPFTVVGDGMQTRDFTYVTDAVSALMTAIKSNRSNTIYNVGSGKTISVNKIVELLGGDKVFIPKRPGEPECTFADITKINEELNWSPKVNIEEGISYLLDNIEYWENAPVWEPGSIEKATKNWFKYLG